MLAYVGPILDGCIAGVIFSRETECDSHAHARQAVETIVGPEGCQAIFKAACCGENKWRG